MSQSKYQKGFMPWERTPNLLLTKAQLGKAKPTVRDLPHDEFVYGDSVPYGPEDSNEVMYKWQYHNPTGQQALGKDIIKTNKQCITKNLHTSSHFYEYRKQNVKAIAPKIGKKQIPIYLPHDKFTYGKPLELQDPIKTLIGNGYGEHEADKLKTFYMNKSQLTDRQPKKLAAYLTKSHLLVKQTAQQKLKSLEWKKTPDTLFKLSKFQNQAAKVDHRRTRAQSQQKAN